MDALWFQLYLEEEGIHGGGKVWVRHNNVTRQQQTTCVHCTNHILVTPLICFGSITAEEMAVEQFLIIDIF